MKRVCCDTHVCRREPLFPLKDQAYQCRKCGRVWTWRFEKGLISDLARWELTKGAHTP